MSTLMGHFVSFPREREKRGKMKSSIEESGTDENEGKVNDSEEIEDIKTSPLSDNFK